MRNALQRMAAGLLSFLMASAVAEASIGELPPVDVKTIVGTWEGISSDEPRLFVFRLDPTAASWVDMAVGDPALVMHFRITSLKVMKGAVTATGVSTGGAGSTIRITGSGRAYRGEGRMNVTISLGDDMPASWKVEMVQRPGGYVAELWRLHEAARRPAN